MLVSSESRLWIEYRRSGGGIYKGFTAKYEGMCVSVAGWSSDDTPVWILETMDSEICIVMTIHRITIVMIPRLCLVMIPRIMTMMMIPRIMMMMIPQLNYDDDDDSLDYDDDDDSLDYADDDSLNYDDDSPDYDDDDDSPNRHEWKVCLLAWVALIWVRVCID